MRSQRASGHSELVSESQGFEKKVLIHAIAQQARNDVIYVEEYMAKKGYIYILSNQYNTTTYIGVTSNLIKRVYQHKNKEVEGFTKKYGLDRLVYFKEFIDIEKAILI